MMRKIGIFLIASAILLSGCSSESEKYMNLANDYFSEGKYDYASYNYIRVLENDRENEDAYLGLIDSYIAQNRLEDAEEYLEKAEQKFGTETLANRREKLDNLIVASTPVEDDEQNVEENLVITEEPKETDTIVDVEVSPTIEPTVQVTITEKPTEESKIDYTYSAMYKTMYTKDSVNVRSLPSSDGDKIGTLGKNQKVVVTGKCNETGWYRIVFDDKDAYVSDNYLVEKVDNKVSATPTVAPKPTNTLKPTQKPTSTPKPTVTPKIDYEQILTKYRNDVDVVYDKVDNDYSVRPKNFLKEDNILAVVQISNDNKTVVFGASLRFIAYDWVFTEEIKVACDDTKYTFDVDLLNRNTDILSGGKIRESVTLVHQPKYSSVDASFVDFEPIVNSIKNSKEVIIRFSGDRREDFILSNEAKENLIMMWEIYLALEYDSDNLKYLQ